MEGCWRAFSSPAAFILESLPALKPTDATSETKREASKKEERGSGPLGAIPASRLEAKRQLLHF